MAILKKIFPILAALLLTSCYEDFTPDIDVKPVLCLNSLIVAGEPVEVEVTHSWLYTHGRDSEVSDARLSIFVNDRLQPEGYIAREGDNIRIVAESATYGRAEAEVTVPVSVKPASLTWTATPINIWHDDLEGWAMNAIIDFNVSAELTITDPADVENYYQFSYYSFCKSSDDIDWGEVDDIYGSHWNPSLLTLGSFKAEFEPIFSEHIGDFEAISGSVVAGFNFFTDRSFSGRDYTLHLFFEGMEFFGRIQEFDESLLDCGLTLVLSTVSKSKYNWANYSWQVVEGMIGDFGDLGLGDPVWGYSNVSTGAGVVAAMSSTTITINLREFLQQFYSGKK